MENQYDATVQSLAWAISLAREMYAKGSKPSAIVNELQRRGIEAGETIRFMIIAREAWRLGIAELKSVEGWTSTVGVTDETAFDGYLIDTIERRRASQ